MNERDIIRFEHMLDAAQASQRIIQGKTRVSLDTNETLGLALQKTIEIIGAAASRIAQETRDQYPQIAWSQVIGMRNILIHAYFNVDLDQVWNAVTDDIPPLIAELEKIIPPETP